MQAPKLSSTKRAKDRGPNCCGGTHAERDLEEMNAEERYAFYQKQLVAAQAELGELDSRDKEANEALNRKRMEEEE